MADILFASAIGALTVTAVILHKRLHNIEDQLSAQRIATASDRLTQIHDIPSKPPEPTQTQSNHNGRKHLGPA